MENNININNETRENVDAALKAVLEHEKAKKEVTDALKKLSRNVEEIVVEKMESKMNAALARIVGRTVIIAAGGVSMIMLATPAAPLSPVVGLAAAAVGYAIIGGSHIYEMSVKKKHEERFKEIQKELNEQLDKYTYSQSKVFNILNVKMALLTEGEDVKKNLIRIRNIVQAIEDESDGLCFKELFLFLEKAKAKYMSVPQDQKENLQINDFLLQAKELMSNVTKAASTVYGAATVGAGSKTSGATALGGASGDMLGTIGTAAAALPLFEIFHGVNILINGVFICQDVKKYMNLRSMKGDKWRAEKIFEENPEEFLKEKELREIIEDIRDEILKSY